MSNNERLYNPQQPSRPIEDAQSGSSSAGGKKVLWSTAYFSQYFDVDTQQVIQRCQTALFPRAHFLDVTGDKPDLYGPFWIITTVVFVLYVASTIAGYLAAHQSGSTYAYDFALLTSAAALMYGYGFIVPTAVWGMMKWYGCEPSLLDCLCLYGYGGMIVWIPVVRIFYWVFLAKKIFF